MCGIAAASNSSVRGLFVKSILETYVLYDPESREPAEIFPASRNNCLLRVD
jgi:hypothetical protein